MLYTSSNYRPLSNCIDNTFLS